MTTFEATENITVTIGDVEKSAEAPLDVDTAQRLAREEGIKKFKVEDSDGSELDTEDFPVSENVNITEYNENA